MSARNILSLKCEKRLWKEYDLVVGVDEVGRGSLAGPLLAGAVAFKPGLSLSELAENVRIFDSKRLSEKQRSVSARWIRKAALGFGIGSVTADYVDDEGVTAATQKTMEEAVLEVLSKFKNKGVFVITDAFAVPYLEMVGLGNQEAVKKGDGKVFSVAAASILAKVTRDKLMVDLSSECPVYGWSKNKGYGTKRHREAIKKHGITEYHRKSFCRKLKVKN